MQVAPASSGWLGAGQIISALLQWSTHGQYLTGLHIQVCLGEYLDGCTGGCPACPVCQHPLTVNLSAPTLVRMKP